MPLESCMIVLDNSEYMRNGDYTPTRFQAQSQAATNIFTTKTDGNPESAVGLMTMAGKSPSILVTPTNDFGKLLSAMNKATIGGVCSLITAIQIAQLALKHRENKNQRQRVIVFIGSPIDDSQEELVKLGKRLRKNNVAIDVVTFGEEGMENDSKISALIEASATEESHLVSVPPGGNQLLSDVVARSPILWDRADAPPPSGGEGEMGDLDLAELEAADPELAMALRMSLQEEQERLAREQPSSSTSAPSTSVEQGLAPQSIPEPTEPERSNATALPDSITHPLHNANDPHIPGVPGDSMDVQGAGMEEDEDEEEMLRRAMALSRGESPDDEDVLMGEGGEEDEDDEDAAIARAIAMSLEESKKDDKK